TTTTNEPPNHDVQAANRDHEVDESLSLSLGSTSYPSSHHSQIPSPPVTTNSSLRLAPPSPFAGPMTTWPTPHAADDDFMASSKAYSSVPFSMTTTPSYLNLSSSSWLNSSFHQRGSQGSFPTMIQPPTTVNRFSYFLPPAQTTPQMSTMIMAPPRINTAVRNSRQQPAGNQKSDTIPPPFPWATNIRGVIHSLEYLESKQITTITGEVQCRHCEQVFEVSYDLRERFREVEKIFLKMKRIMRERAPPMWLNPEQRRCELCGRDKAVKPVVAESKSQINWLFLLLGQTLGYCTLEQLKNFCKHCKSHRTGAKDRVLYLTYLGLCKMLDPTNSLYNRGDTNTKR
ncbi:hypothetical protein CARUB_v10012580mg, partial [Capsella rubella]